MKSAMMVGGGNGASSATQQGDAAAAAAAAHSFLLDDDSSIPFTAEDVATRVDDAGLYGELPVPSCLADGGSFDFLRRDLRRGGLSSSSAAAASSGGGGGAGALASQAGPMVTPPGLPRVGGGGG